MRQNLQSGFFISVFFVCLLFSSTHILSQTFTTPGTGSVAIPANSRVVIEVWGAGGAGSSATSNKDHGSGGGGGAYASDTFIVSSATTFFYEVGQGGSGSAGGTIDGGSSFVYEILGTNLAEAGGGLGAVGVIPGSGGIAISGAIRFNGGSGAQSSTSNSGGGGSSAGVDITARPFSGTDGADAFGIAGGVLVAPFEGGNGADGFQGAGSNGDAGKAPGGGGSGGYKGSTRIGGNGGDGQVRITISSCGENTWIGAVSNDWYDASNWSCGEVPSPDNGHVVIPDVSTSPQIMTVGGDPAAFAFSMTIEPGARLDVQDNNSLTVERELKIDGSLVLNGEAQLLQLSGSTFDDTSTGFLRVDQQGTADLYTYNYWSSPVYTSVLNTYTVATVLPDINFIDGLNGSPGPPVSIANRWIYKFADKTAEDYNGWFQIGSTGPLASGEGFTMKGPGTVGVNDLYTYTFQGKPNNGIISLGLTAGKQYLVGNPYPSAIDADQFILDNIPEFDGTLYFWEHWGGGSHYLSDYQGGYATYNLSGGIGTGTPAAGSVTNKTPQRYIPVGQGFFITADTGGTITFNNAQRDFVTESSGNSIFFKNQEVSKTAKTDLRRKLRIGLEMDKGYSKEILLTEDSNTTEGFDYGYDGKLRDGYSHDIYWSIDAERFAIQGVPEITKNSVFELGIQMEAAGNIRLQVNSFENNNSLKQVYLLDRELNTTTKILDNSVSLSLAQGDYNGRFAIVFLPAAKVFEEESDLSKAVQAVMNNSEKEIQITRMVELEISEVALFNLLGQKLYSTKTNLQDRFLRIPVNQDQGVYLLRVVTDKGATGKQIFVE